MSHSDCNLPSISILVTCYNCGPFIHDALDSIYNQDYKGPLECIIVDDASTDDSPAQIENFIKEHSKKLPITFIRKEQNSGVAETMDIAMSMAKHEWFIMADGDDIQLPNRCSRSIELLRQYPKALIMSMGARHIDQSGNLLDTYQPPFYVPYHLAPEVLYLESHEHRVANWLDTPQDSRISNYHAPQRLRYMGCTCNKRREKNPFYAGCNLVHESYVTRASSGHQRTRYPLSST